MPPPFALAREAGAQAWLGTVALDAALGLPGAYTNAVEEFMSGVLRRQ